MIEEDEDLGDERIEPRKLRRLLEKRPDLAIMLYVFILRLIYNSFFYILIHLYLFTTFIFSFYVHHFAFF